MFGIPDDSNSEDDGAVIEFSPKLDGTDLFIDNSKDTYETAALIKGKILEWQTNL